MTTSLNRQRLEELLAEFPRRKIALLGDLFLDRYLELADVEEISIETGLEAYQVERVRNAPGALGTVMNNLAALGVGTLTPVTVIGDDGHGFDLRRAMGSLPLDDSHLLGWPDRLTPTYTKPLRPVDGGWVELNRLDVRTRAPLPPEAVDRVADSLRRAWHEADGLIALDQVAEPDCGVVTRRIRELLAELAAETPGKLMLIDSRCQLAQFAAGTLKGNRAEVLEAAGEAADESANDATDEVLRRAIGRLQQRNGRRVYCTCGAEGIWIAGPEGIEKSPGVAVRGRIDIVGAGDSVTAALAASLLSGATPVEAAALANLAASISIQKLGQTGVATPDELRGACV